MENVVSRVEKIKEELKNCWTTDSKYNILTKKLKEEEEPLRKATKDYIKNYLDSKWKGIHITKSSYFDQDGDILKGLEYKIDRRNSE